MKLTSHYVPFLKSAPPKTLRVLGLSALLTALACTGTRGLALVLGLKRSRREADRWQRELDALGR